MASYKCIVCGYVHSEKPPKNFICPICRADESAFAEENAKSEKVIKQEANKELSPLELSVICSNLARGAEKQYLQEVADNFKKLSAFFKGKAEKENGNVLENAEKDLSLLFPYANAVASENKDRGAMRALVWSEKVTNMQKSLLAKFEKEGEKAFENTGIYVCTICGFISIGEKPLDLCPVCKVPSWKFEKVEKRG